MYYIGIDAGKKGGYAIIKDKTLCCYGLFDKRIIIPVFYTLSKPSICCLEKVHAMPKQGSVSMFSFGENYGWWKGVLEALGIPYQEISPQTWKKEFGLNSDKTNSIEVCRQLFPDAELIPPNCRKPHDGIAEAILMALYAKRKLDNHTPQEFDEESWD